METKETLFRRITPSEGCMLTQSADVPEMGRTFSNCIILAANDSPDNWRDIPKEEAEAIMARQEEQRRADAEAQEREAKKRDLQAQLDALNGNNDGEPITPAVTEN